MQVHNVVMKTVLGIPWLSRVTMLLHELYQFSFAFLVQFKMLIITFKSLNGTELGYLQDFLFLNLFYQVSQWAYSRSFPLDADISVAAPSILGQKANCLANVQLLQMSQAATNQIRLRNQYCRSRVIALYHLQ